MASCKVCDEPLVLEVEDEEVGGVQTFPDDLELPCGCRFHWQCLMDQASEVAMSLKCPACHSQLATNTAGPSVTNPFLHVSAGARILTRYQNEGGLQEDLDILPEITEEAYLEANPEARPARAFHVMCTEGDIDGIIELLRAVDRDQNAAGAGGSSSSSSSAAEDNEPSLNPAQLMRYQDPLNNSKTGLHLAVENGQEEIVWLLLWLASPLSAEVFPPAAVNAAHAMGLQRPATTPADDIRLLQDNGGRTAESVAAGMDGIWNLIVEAGALRPGV